MPNKISIFPSDVVMKHNIIAKANTNILFLFSFDYYYWICLRATTFLTGCGFGCGTEGSVFRF